MTATSTHSPFTDEEPTWPQPPRFWWLRRLALGLVLLPVALVTLRLAWGWEADRRIAAANDRWQARVRAAGVTEPNRPREDDVENGARVVAAAAAMVDRNAWSPANAASDFNAAYTPYSPGWHHMAGAAVAANEKAFSLARQSRRYDRFNWGSPALRSPGGLYTRLNDVRALANTLGDAAEYAHEMGDDVAALEAIRDLRHISMGLRGQPMVVNDLVGVGIEAITLARLHEITPGLRIARENNAAASKDNSEAAREAALPSTKQFDPPRRLTPANVRALIGQLLDDTPRNRGTAGAFVGERATLADMAADPHNARWLVRPMWRLDALRVDDVLAANVECGTQPSWPTGLDALRAARSRLPGVPAPAMSLFWPAAPTPPPRETKRRPIDFPRLLSQDFSGGLASGRAVEQNWRVAMDRRLAAVGLAVRLFRVENGRWPGLIEELVPKYLPFVPQDPMAADGSGLRYALVSGGLPGGGDRPVAYSAGPDGAFGTTPSAQMPKEPCYSWLSGAGDQWRDLERWQPPAPTTAPSTQAADH